MNQLVASVAATVSSAAVMWAAARVLWRRSHARARAGEVVLFLGICYAAAVVAIVIVPLPMTSARNPGQVTNSFVPVLNTISRIHEAASTRRFMLVHEIYNTVGNIIMFVPAGIFLPLCFERMHSMRRVLFAAFCISASIEIAQLVSRAFGVYRSIDVDDVILNVLGAALGYGIFRLFRGSNA